MSKSKNRNGKPTEFQLAALKKAGVATNGIKTYRDAENALKRLSRKAKGKGAAKNTAKDAKAEEKATKKAKPPRIAGIGVFNVSISKATIIEALLLGFAKSIIDVFGDGCKDCGHGRKFGCEDCAK